MLPESWRRVFYARAHLDSLADEVSAYRERHKDSSLRRVHNLDVATNRYVRLEYLFDVSESVPDAWGFMVGDVLHNLQSALDNLIWSLAVQESGPNPPNERAIGFPAFREPEDFDRRTPSTLQALHPNVRAEVKRLQPFSNPDTPVDLSPIWLLHELDRLDKHRSVHVVRHQQHAFDIEVTPTPDDLDVQRHPTAALEHDTPVATVTFRRPVDTVQMDVKPIFSYYEAIEETSETPLLPLGGFLENLMLDVGACFLHLTPFLRAPGANA